MFGFGKRHEPKKHVVNVASMVRGVLLDSGLWDSEKIEDYSIINQVLHHSPISNDVLERELQDSDDRRDELERIVPLVVTMSTIMVEAMMVNAQNKDTDESHIMKSVLLTEETKVAVSTLLSGTALGIISQLMEVKLLTKGWK